ncbi:GntR family transcriptional regulator [Pseudonocardia sp. NPDC049635]|uniref:GntR family transcriptional regulator n=1 Tax=Pseudonocardia sp. NPDC049635 TaxID=3155506 RepID=UPI0033EEC1F1
MPRRRGGRSAETLEQAVSRHLAAEILSLRLRPGEHIVADNLAADLGVSRLPVREALRNLNGTGLVELRPFRGAFVTSLEVEDLDEIIEVFEARMHLEPWVAGMAAERRSAEELTRLDAILAEGLAGLAARDAVVMNRAHHHFLRTLASMARHDTAARLLTPLHNRTMLAFVSVQVKIEPAGWEAHQQVRDLIAAGDGAGAAHAMREHLAEMVDALRLEGNVVPSVLGGRSAAARVNARSRRAPGGTPARR